jgi:hypothetical protein
MVIIPYLRDKEYADIFLDNFEKIDNRHGLK